MHFYIVQVKTADGDWHHIATYDNEKGADGCYYECLKNDTTRNYRIREEKIIKESNR